MADQGIWFKLHCSAVDDPDLDNLDIADFGRWAKLGAIIKRQGNDGGLLISPPARALCAMFQVADFDALIERVSMLPHVTVRRDNSSVSSETNAPVSFSVEFDNWLKYQGDFSTDRVRRWREKNHEMKRSKRRGEEKRGEKKRIEEKTTPLPPSAEGESWPSPYLLIKLYNESVCNDLPAVEKITPKRLKKAREYLKTFPDQSFWQAVFAEINQSPFLRGLRNREGHESFKATFDWLLTTGRDGTENVAKVFEGRFRA